MAVRPKLVLSPELNSNTHYCTLSGLQNHPAGTIVCDEASIGEVKVNSYRYFKAVEAAENR